MKYKALPEPRTAQEWRNSAGRAWFRNPGLLPIITERTDWLRGSSYVLSHIPLHIAEQLAGRTFSRFDQLRETLWKTVADDELVSGIYRDDHRRDKAKSSGIAPIASESQQIVVPKRNVTGKIKHVLSSSGKTTGVILESTVDPESLKSYVLHHKQPIHDCGGVYDLSNLVIVTPLTHDALLDPSFHYQQQNMPQWKADYIAKKVAMSRSQE